MAVKTCKQIQQDWKSLSQEQKDAILSIIKILTIEKNKYDNHPVDYYINTLLLLTIDDIEDFLVSAWEIVENLDCPELTQPNSQQDLMNTAKSALVLVEALNNKIHQIEKWLVDERLLAKAMDSVFPEERFTSTSEYEKLHPHARKTIIKELIELNKLPSSYEEEF